MAIQKIIFGPPGVGKSHHVHNTIKKNFLNIKNENVFTTIFHPEYRYGDFVGKLLPYCENGNITYRYFRGPFLKALAKAYKNILDSQNNKQNNNEKTQSDKENSDNGNNKIQDVLLIIDEINRGNSAAIFGSIFQLLDRAENGWSQYSIMISELEWEEFLKEIGFEVYISQNEKKYFYNNEDIKTFEKKIKEQINPEKKNQQNNTEKSCNIEPFKEGYLKLPPNFHIVATMNTSDESIYYMDSAFKRRWDWEYLDINGKSFSFDNKNTLDKETWNCLRKYLNDFIKDHAEYVGGNVEDKLLGKWFLKEVSYEKLINKVLFHLWDSIFSRNKEPLKELVYGNEQENKTENKEIVTFGDFVNAFDGNFKTIKQNSEVYCNQNKKTSGNTSDKQTDTKENSD